MTVIMVKKEAEEKKEALLVKKNSNLVALGNHVMHINIQTCIKRWVTVLLFLHNMDYRFDKVFLRN